MLVDITSITYNEEVMLPMWIEAWLKVPFVNKIYLIDGGSTDRSLEIANSYDRVSVTVVPWKNDFARQRNIAIKKAKSPWLMQPDIDELPCGSSPDEVISCLESNHWNQIHLPYLKFYDWDTLWFFKDGNTPKINGNQIVFGTKSTMTIFRKGHLSGYTKTLHEMPVFFNEKKEVHVTPVRNLEELDHTFFLGHYDQAKHNLQAAINGTSLEFEMGLKRVRYRLINPATYEGKLYDSAWAAEALEKLKKGDKAMIEDLGAKQLRAFLNQHNILQSFSAAELHHKAVKKYIKEVTGDAFCSK